MPFDPKNAADGVWLGFSVIVLVASFQLVLLPTMVDGFRDRLFTLRRELFLLAADGRIAPTHPAYAYLRNALNAHIRYAERITFVRGFLAPMLAMTIRPTLVRHRRGVDEVAAAISDEDVRSAIFKIRNGMYAATAWHVVATSPIAWIVALIVVPIAVITAAVAGTIGALKAKLVTEVSERVECEVEALMATA